MLIITELDLFGIVVYPKTENLYLFQWLYLRVVSSILKLIGSFILYMLFGASEFRRMSVFNKGRDCL